MINQKMCSNLLAKCNFILIILILAISCNPSKNNSEEYTFENLTTLELPFEAKCGQDYDIFYYDSLSKLVPAIPDNLKFGGVLKQKNGFYAMLLINPFADETLPFFATVDTFGNIIDQLQLYQQTCHQDAYYWGEGHFHISENLIIIIQDSSALYERDSMGEIIESSIKSISNRQKFLVNDKGNIVKIK